MAAQEWGPKTEAQGGLDREGEEGRPFGIGGKKFEGGERRRWGLGGRPVSAEGEMWLGELAEGRGVDGVVDGARARNA